MGGEETAVTAVRTIEDVQSDDAAFRAAESVTPPMIPAEEGAARSRTRAPPVPFLGGPTT